MCVPACLVCLSGVCAWCVCLMCALNVCVCLVCVCASVPGIPVCDCVCLVMRVKCIMCHRICLWLGMCSASAASAAASANASATAAACVIASAVAAAVAALFSLSEIESGCQGRRHTHCAGNCCVAPLGAIRLPRPWPPSPGLQAKN